eukprot:TRINITY_DN10313_c0_g1_i5.p1 TRINITY_DN10313_c0_g1~~TRINITY_DN10313_c0_g1_i5.p1  ORF type:complete len:233 (-),score=40.25 TRINITY_DN10313_c0_g1_i5:719-1378(-)
MFASTPPTSFALPIVVVPAQSTAAQEASRSASSTGLRSSGKALVPRTAAADRVPAPKASGNEILDDAARGNRVMLMDIIDHCIRDSSHIQSLFMKLQSRLRSNIAVGDDFFPSELKNLSRDPEPFMIGLLSELGDFTGCDIVQAKRYDSEAVRQLRTFTFQLPDNLALPSYMQEKAFSKMVFNDRACLCGHRLRSFSTKGLQRWPRGLECGLVRAGVRR